VSRDRRFPRSVYEAGAEPDARFSLANERTFLAWIRTALAFIAGGLAVEALQVPQSPLLRLAISVLLILSGLASAWQSWFGWRGTERALRHVSPLPSAGVKLPISILVVAVGVLVVVGLFT
jgi:putative membrane protein